MSGNQLWWKPDWSKDVKIKWNWIWSQVDNTRILVTKNLDIRDEINRILEDIQENYLVCRPGSKNDFELKMACSDNTKEIVSGLISIVKFRLLSCEWNREDLIIACRIAYKLINEEIFKEEMELIKDREKKLALAIKRRVNPQVGRIISEIEIILEQCWLEEYSNDNSIKFILFIQKVIKTLEEKLKK